MGGLRSYEHYEGEKKNNNLEDIASECLTTSDDKICGYVIFKRRSGRHHTSITGKGSSMGN